MRGTLRLASSLGSPANVSAWPASSEWLRVTSPTTSRQTPSGTLAQVAAVRVTELSGQLPDVGADARYGAPSASRGAARRERAGLRYAPSRLSRGARRRLQRYAPSRPQFARAAGTACFWVLGDALEDLGLLRLELGVREDAGGLQLAELLELVERVGCRRRRRGGLLILLLTLGLVLLGPAVRLPARRRGSRPRSRFPRSRLRGRLLGAMASVTPFYAFADSSDSDASCRSGAGMPPLATSCAPLALTAAANGRAQRFS